MGPKETLLKAIQTVSLTDLAKKSGISVNVLSQLKAGRYHPSEERIQHLLKCIYEGDLRPLHSHTPVMGIELPQPKQEPNIITKMEDEIKELEERVEAIRKAISIVRMIGRK